MVMIHSYVTVYQRVSLSPLSLLVFVAFLWAPHEIHTVPCSSCSRGALPWKPLTATRRGRCIWRRALGIAKRWQSLLDRALCLEKGETITTPSW